MNFACVKNSLTQFFDQRLRLLQVFGVETFGEPVVDLGQHLVSFCSSALLLPQSRQACRRAKFPRLRLLMLSDLNGFKKTRFSFCLRIRERRSGVSDF